MADNENNTITVNALGRALQQKLAPIYGDGEARAMTRLIFHHLKGWDATQLIINGDLPASERIIKACGEILARLQRHEPLQYILGEARFYGMDLKVTPAVLIPRPETAELVDMIVSENRRDDLRVLDVGTGSGAIAIALARNHPFAQVTALDVSEAALKVAAENAHDLKADIRMVHADIFSWEPSPASFDIVVSNPPYIPEEEKAGMEANVLEHEPAQALFVPDDNPLVYYRRIADVARKALTGGGRLYFEINPRFVEQLRRMLADKRYTDVEATRDAQGRYRFISASNPGDDGRDF